MRLRIGVSQATKELELDVDDPRAVVDGYGDAVDRGDVLFWIDQVDGSRFAVVVGNVLYFELEADRRKSVGFGA